MYRGTAVQPSVRWTARGILFLCPRFPLYNKIKNACLQFSKPKYLSSLDITTTPRPCDPAYRRLRQLHLGRGVDDRCPAWWWLSFHPQPRATTSAWTPGVLFSVWSAERVGSQVTAFAQDKRLSRIFKRRCPSTQGRHCLSLGLGRAPETGEA